MEIAKKDESSILIKREMKKGLKRHWGFTCGGCDKKCSSKVVTEFYVLNWEILFNTVDNCKAEWVGFRFCTRQCLLDHLASAEVTPELVYEGIDKWQALIDGI